MKIELKTVKSNPLFERREVSFKIEDSKTPSRLEVRKELATMLKTDEDCVWVKHMATRTGTNLTIGLVHVYDNPQKALSVEPKHIIKRNKPSTKEKIEEEAAQ
ncbi:30S ribosomal protein S24e [Candidatus Bathyarchaeota archaeon]|nr:30S ribosomal protein S24e [Candidatus Bathyarchaeota archaeon]